MSASSDAYRNETESLNARIASLEEELAAKQGRVDELEKQLSDHDAVFNRLKSVIDRSPPPTTNRPERFGGGARHIGRGLLATGAALAIIAGGSVMLVARRGSSSAVQLTTPQAIAATEAPVALATAPPAPLDVCKDPGVHFTLNGGDAFAPARSERDLSGHKYTRNGSRSPWFTVNGGPLYVHGVGGFLPGDVGTTDLSLLTLITKGDSAGGYTLANGGKSFLDVQGSNGKQIYGRFEADVSKVDDTTRTPPFGTPVVRVRGSFCLPAMLANPSDTGP